MRSIMAIIVHEIVVRCLMLITAGRSALFPPMATDKALVDESIPSDL